MLPLFWTYPKDMEPVVLYYKAFDQAHVFKGNLCPQLDGSKSSNMDVRLGAVIALERGMLHAISLHNFWWFRNFHALRMVLCVGKHVQMLNSRAYVWNVDSVDW